MERRFAEPAMTGEVHKAQALYTMLGDHCGRAHTAQLCPPIQVRKSPRCQGEGESHTQLPKDLQTAHTDPSCTWPGSFSGTPWTICPELIFGKVAFTQGAFHCSSEWRTWLQMFPCEPTAPPVQVADGTSSAYALGGSGHASKCFLGCSRELMGADAP